MQMAPGPKPSENIGHELDGLGIAQIHQQPVGEHQIHTACRQLQPQGIPNVPFNIPKMGILLPVLLYEIGHKVSGHNSAGSFGKFRGKAAVNNKLNLK
jgi:hypothetical protein